MNKVQSPARLTAMAIATLFVLTLSTTARGQSSEPPDQNESGYTSSYLAGLDRTTSGENENGRARLEAIREARGMNRGFAWNVLQQANIQRQLFPQLLPGAATP